MIRTWRPKPRSRCGFEVRPRTADPDGEREHVPGAQAPRRKRVVHDGADEPDRRDGNAEGEGPDHPFPMEGDLADSDGQEPSHDRDQEQAAEKGDGRRFRRSAERHEQAKKQPAQRGGDGGEHDDTPRPSMEPDVAAPDPRGELERCEQQEEAAGEYVEPGHDRVGGEPAVELVQLLRPVRGKRVLSIETVHELRPDGVEPGPEIGKVEAPGECRHQADRREQAHGAP